MIYVLLTLALLLPVQRPARPPIAKIPVPQGWTAELNTFDLVIEHSSGAALKVLHRRADDLDAFAQLGADRLASPLGFAQIGAPAHFNDGTEEWIQYEIRGNRIADHRRILYRVMRDLNNRGGIIEITYDNSEARFDVLLTEAQSIVAQFLSLDRR
jgi:hypothetical protein